MRFLVTSILSTFVIAAAAVPTHPDSFVREICVLGCKYCPSGSEAVSDPVACKQLGYPSAYKVLCLRGCGPEPLVWGNQRATQCEDLD